jgi:hypothetical protein
LGDNAGLLPPDTLEEVAIERREIWGGGGYTGAQKYSQAPMTASSRALSR